MDADKVLSIANMKKKPQRTIKPPEGDPPDGAPVKLLTLTDLPKRVSVVRRRELAQRKEQAMVRASRGEYNGPKMFADYVADGIWRGHRCFIIGGGPSAKNLDFSLLQGELTIGINRAYELLDPTILFGVDGQLFGWAELGELGEESKRRFNDYKGYKVWMALHKMYPPDIYLIDPDEDEGYRIGTTRRLAYKNNSGYGAINLAAALGANPIYLIGFDMHGDKQGHQKWWHGGYPVDYGEGIYARYIEEFNGFAPVLEKAGIEVVNLNPKSALKCFTFGNYKKVMASKTSTPVALTELIPKPDTITAITPTGDRPLAFALCQHWMETQTRRPDQWIVVDDGRVPMEPPVGAEYIRRRPRKDDPEHTLHLNLQAALPHIKGNKILVIEDDEYYAPGYVAFVEQLLDRSEVAGICNSRYYHLPAGGYVRIGNMAHASLAQTGFRSSFLPTLNQLLLEDTKRYLDMRMWDAATASGTALPCTDSPQSLYVGIKGLPGRKGIGQGHNPSLYGKSLDKTRDVLKAWAGADSKVYLDILNGELTEANCKHYFPRVTGVVVCYNTKELMQRAYESVRKFHPEMPIIIVDGSDRRDPCAEYVQGLQSELTTVIVPGYNIGHGKGMDKGIGLVRTPYALLFDSDIEMLQSPVEDMLAMMKPETYGVGYIEHTDFGGYGIGARPECAGEDMPYLHPYFQLLNVAMYHKFSPYVHHGAPCYLAMRDIYEQGLSDAVLKVFPGLWHTAGSDYGWKGKPSKWVRHDVRGTRDARVRRGLPEIEGNWVMGAAR